MGQDISSEKSKVEEADNEDTQRQKEDMSLTTIPLTEKYLVENSQSMVHQSTAKYPMAFFGLPIDRGANKQKKRAEFYNFTQT